MITPEGIVEQLFELTHQIYQRGGWLTIPLGLCSVIMLTVIMERLWNLRFRKLFPYAELQQLKVILVENPTHIERYPIPQNHPVGRILAKALGLRNDKEQFKEAMRDQARQELHRLQRGLVVLEIIVGVAPLLGLLGTAVGMIDVFDHLALEGAGRTEALSRGISEALMTTILGLSIGIPALIAFNLFNRKIASLALSMEQELLPFYQVLFPPEAPHETL